MEYHFYQRQLEYQAELAYMRLKIETQGIAGELLRANRLLAAVREEERHRLRRDIHDGLGPLVAAVALQADTARELVDSDPNRAKALMLRLSEQARCILQEVQRLVYALRPPVLDSLGLVEALRRFMSSIVARHVQLSLEACEPFPLLPAAVETAAYRIGTEAITNVVRHANARCCQVRLQAAEGLTLEVIDDGQGLPADAKGGLGLLGMRERARELGGDCIIERLPDGGTRVQAWLPLA